MDISQLKEGDKLIEKHPMGYTMPITVFDNPVLNNDVWEVKTMTSIYLMYTYRQLPNGDILNIGDQKTELIFAEEDSSQ